MSRGDLHFYLDLGALCALQAMTLWSASFHRPVFTAAMFGLFVYQIARLLFALTDGQFYNEGPA